MLDSPARRVGIIGLGRMGGAMAARLLAAGHAVDGFDVDAGALARLVASGGKATDSPAAAARRAEVLLIMVHDAAQVETVLFAPGTGAAQTLPPGCVVWLASTVPPAFATRLAERLAAHGIAFIDGPVSGGLTGAEDGQLVAICGATAEALASADFVLRACTHRVHCVGAPGAGSTVKMINQVLVASHAVLACEAMALAMRAGLDPAQLISVVTGSSGNSQMFQKRAPRIAAGEHEVHASIDTLRKDLAIAIDAAEQLGIEPTVARAVHGLLRSATDAGRGAESDTTLVRDYLGTEGVTISLGLQARPSS